MQILDLKKELKHLYASTKKVPTLIEVPKMKFIMFDGKGHPEESDFQLAAEAIYTISYILKFEFARKKHNVDYKVMPMEVIWNLDRSNKISFTWTMMIMQPSFITEGMFKEAIELAARKGKNIEYRRLRFEEYQEGLCVQAFHLGDYNKMNTTLEKMIERFIHMRRIILNSHHPHNEKISYFHFTFCSTAPIIIHSVLWIFYMQKNSQLKLFIKE